MLSIVRSLVACGVTLDDVDEQGDQVIYLFVSL